MQGARFNSATALTNIVRKSEDKRYDILSNENYGAYGSMLFMDGMGSDNSAYEIEWETTDNKSNPLEIKIISHKHYEDGEW